MAASESPPLADTPISSATNTGVMKMPAMLESEALHTAAGTFPRAMAVKAIEDWTVEGSSVRNSSPCASAGERNQEEPHSTPRPSSGNIRKVAANTTRWSRQAVRPATIAARDSLAPWRKKSSAIAACVRSAKPSAARPRQGSSVATTTVAIRSML